MDLKAAQCGMRTDNVAGAPGVLVSGIVWVVAGLVWLRLDVTRAFAVLFFGGMAIMPSALFIARVLSGYPDQLTKTRSTGSGSKRRSHYLQDC